MRGFERRISVGITDLIFRVAIAVISKGSLMSRAHTDFVDGYLAL